ncbi:MAG: hypothetical protein JNL38_27405 [Myxococcales bacterium]|nr:hypothetical protein [Myxococcales bacterium]
MPRPLALGMTPIDSTRTSTSGRPRKRATHAFARATLSRWGATAGSAIAIAFCTGWGGASSARAFFTASRWAGGSLSTRASSCRSMLPRQNGTDSSAGGTSTPGRGATVIANALASAASLHTPSSPIPSLTTLHAGGPLGPASAAPPAARLRHDSTRLHAARATTSAARGMARRASRANIARA